MTIKQAGRPFGREYHWISSVTWSVATDFKLAITWSARMVGYSRIVFQYLIDVAWSSSSSQEVTNDAPCKATHKKCIRCKRIVKNFLGHSVSNNLLHAPCGLRIEPHAEEAIPLGASRHRLRCDWI